MVENLMIECPFCHNQSVKATFIPSHFEAHTSRISKGSKTTFYKTKEKYDIQSLCSNCGKTAKQIQKALDEGKKDPEKEGKILKRLKEQGLDFSNIETKF